MQGCNRWWIGLLWVTPLAASLASLTTTQVAAAEILRNTDAPVVSVNRDSATSYELYDSVYWRALNGFDEHERFVADETDSLELVSLSFHQDLAAPRPLPFVPAPSISATPAGPTSVAAIFSGRSRPPLVRLASRSRSRPRIAADRILGTESRPRSATDIGSLLSRSARNRGVVAQKRNPIITDPRIRGSRVGQLAASGSHWVPARIDLDTILNKIDSRTIEDVVVVKGPYSVQNGPGVSFVDFKLLDSPRSESLHAGGSSSLDYSSNGQQSYGRQTASISDEEWGLRVGYGHRTGNDYEAGDGASIPSSYKSRSLDVAFGFEPTIGQNLELMYLRLDQTDVELPGQAFDIDSLVTDGFEAMWTDENIDWADELAIEGWANQTDVKGNAQRSGKRRTFPFLDAINFVGTTNIASLSTGASLTATWKHDDKHRSVAGVDVRVIRQELDEIASGRFGFNVFIDANSPIPRSTSVNPGLFLEHTVELDEHTLVTGGLRTHVVTTELLDPASGLQSVGTSGVPLSAMLGTGDFDQSFGLWSGYLTAEHAIDDRWKLNAAAGYGMRPPSLTEMYVAESFMFLLQSGLNTVTGDPRLDPERQWQIDVGLDYSDGDQFSASGNFFHAWVHDRITFEAMSVRPGPFGQIEQANLKYVNTERATLFGFEGEAQWKLMKNAALFGQLSYVEGTDQTRNGNFATQQARSGPLTPSVQVTGMPRGAFSGVMGESEESLPGIPPLESRVGVRLAGAVGDAPVSLEIAARIVTEQDKVASSLLETATPGFTVFDARGFLQLTDAVSVVAGVENFTDRNYREHFDFRSPAGQSIRQPGIDFYLGSEVIY